MQVYLHRSRWIYPCGVVTQLKRAPHDKWSYICSRNNCSIDESHGSWRVSFTEPGGMLDNYTAIVYDPTGKVVLANQFKGHWSNLDSPELRWVKKLFGGDLTHAEPLGGPWYRCSFRIT